MIVISGAGEAGAIEYIIWFFLLGKKKSECVDGEEVFIGKKYSLGRM